MKKLHKTEIFPKRIRKYSYYKTLTNLKRKSRFNFAIYRDEKNNEYICKVWIGKKKDQRYYWIENEIKSYRLLHELHQDNKELIEKKFPEIFIPKLYDSVISVNKAYLLIDKVTGKVSHDFSPKEVISTYSKVISYFSFISKLISKKKILITHRNAFHYFFLFHLYLLKAFRHSSLSLTDSLSCLKTFYTGIFYLFSQDSHYLVHRDVGGANNVLIDKKKISIIDFEILTQTYQIVQIANIISTEWPNQEFIQHFFSSTMFKKIKGSVNELRTFKSMLVYSAIVDLSTGIKENTVVSLSILDTANNL